MPMELLGALHDVDWCSTSRTTPRQLPACQKGPATSRAALLMLITQTIKHLGLLYHNHMARLRVVCYDNVAV